ncbi:MAG: iron(III) transport system ATP-binding protein [Oleispira sp.]|jgi:iron(III) transport system ATP-binding protein
MSNNNYAQKNITALELFNIQLAIGEQKILQALTFDLSEGEILCLLGPSGCGKTTALKTIAGLSIPQQGQISLFGHAVFSDNDINQPPEQRSIGFIFQDYALFPHMTVAQNIAYGLSNLNAQEKRLRIKESLELVELTDLEHRYPHELSGGQQQRIAVARALAPKPKLLLMDEPFSNIDGQVKRRMMADLRRLLKKHNISCIFVTHAKEEAFAFADKTAVMIDGHIEQLDIPAKVFNQPNTLTVAEFMESGNLATLKHSQQVLDRIPAKWPRDIDNSGYWLFKPQHLILRRSLLNTGIVLIDSTYIGRGYQHEIAIRLTKSRLASTTIWKAETEVALDIAIGENIALEYAEQPHWLQK